MSMATARRRVRKGAALLDDKMPGWAEQIDPNVLDLGSGSKCVLGQLFPGKRTVKMPYWVLLGYPSVTACVRALRFYSPLLSQREARREVLKPTAYCGANYAVGRYVVGLTEKACVTHGFNTHNLEEVSHHELDAAWTAEITKRVSA